MRAKWKRAGKGQKRFVEQFEADLIADFSIFTVLGKLAVPAVGFC